MVDDESRYLPVPVVFVAAGEGTARERKRKMPFTEGQRDRYVQLIRQGYRRTRAAELVGVHGSTVTRTLHADEDFRADVLDAEAARIDEVEEALFETAIAGNVMAQQIVLFNRRPEDWADTRTIRVRDELLRAAEEEKELRSGDEVMKPAIDLLRDKILELRDQYLRHEAEREEAVEDGPTTTS